MAVALAASPHHPQPVSPARVPADGAQGRGEKKKPATLRGQYFIPGLLGRVLDFLYKALRAGGVREQQDYPLFGT